MQHQALPTFRILGPLEIEAAGHPIAVSSPKQRIALATLLLHANEVVPAATLIERVWERPPPQAKKTLQGYIARLRRLLGDDTIGTRPPGYLIEVAPEQLDLLRFAELRDAARAEGTDPETASRLLGQALSLWRGPVLADVPPASPLRGEIAVLEEWRLQALEWRISADLELGRYVQLVPELQELTARHPLRENFWGHLVAALHGSGRRAEALSSYAKVRSLLVEELGMEPSAALQTLQRAILNEDAPPVATGGPTPPRSLPRDIPDLVGRAEELETIAATLTGMPEAWPTGGYASPVVMLPGQGGIGKTTMAVRVAHECGRAFPDGQIYVDLRGTRDPVEPGAALATILTSLGIEGSGIPDGLDARVAFYRSVLSERRVLLLLDDAATEAQVRPLLPTWPTCGVIVTSRKALRGLEGVRHVQLDVLSHKEAIALLSGIAGEDQITANSAAAAQVARLCGYLPLALRIAASRLVGRTHWTIDHLARRLTSERHRLDELAAGDLAVRASIELGYRDLQPAAQRAFRLLGTLNMQAVPLSIAAAALDVPPHEAEHLLEEMTDRNMLNAGAGGTSISYSFHDLLRLYAAERSLAEDPPEVRLNVVRWACEAWAHAATRAQELLALPPVTVAWQVPSTRRSTGVDHLIAEVESEPRHWLEDQHEAVVSACVQASELGLGELAHALAAAVAPFLDWQGYFDLWHRVALASLSATQSAGHRREIASSLLSLGNLYEGKGEFIEAKNQMERAHELLKEAGDEVDTARAAVALALELGEGGDLAAHQRLCEQALPVLRAAGDELGQAAALHHLALAYLFQHHPLAAKPYAEQSLSLYLALGSPFGMTLARSTLLECEQHLGNVAEAKAHAKALLGVVMKQGVRRLEVFALHIVADMHLSLGDFAAAREAIGPALRIAQDTGWEQGLPRLLCSFGELCYGEGAVEDGTRFLKEALAIWNKNGSRVGRERVLAALARHPEAAGMERDPARLQALLARELNG
ncbi:BTAD domain-containing putative transcriptional regulator [Nonomuraea sp. NPDC050404]|uniref:AfsR/SARP family transcriptional regulator n=1 Tax=Nonomuraea sp. NPDC050404 TaxID=3155783 RepID=UPI0034060450